MDIPHQTVIIVKISGEIYEKLPTGQIVKPKDKIKSHSKVFTIVGENLEDCKIKTDAFLEKLKGKLYE